MDTKKQDDCLVLCTFRDEGGFIYLVFCLFHKHLSSFFHVSESMLENRDAKMNKTIASGGPQLSKKDRQIIISYSGLSWVSKKDTCKWL